VIARFFSFLHRGCYFRLQLITVDNAATDYLREFSVKLMPSTFCAGEKSYGKEFHSSTMLCAEYLRGGKDSCSGDSGGLLQCVAGDGRWRLIGIVSIGRSCALINKPGLYTRVDVMLRWINKYVKGISSSSSSAAAAAAAASYCIFITQLPSSPLLFYCSLSTE